MVSSTPKLNIQTSKLDTKNDNSEDELLKFFLHGSYDVQHRSQSQEPTDKNVCMKTAKVPLCNLIDDDTKTKSRCMFEESYMINVSVKQPNIKPTGKQIDVRIEKSLSDGLIANENVGLNERSNEEEKGNKEINSSVPTVIKTPPIPSILQAPSLPNKVRYDEKLYRYLDYLETKEESNQSVKPTKHFGGPSTSKIQPKQESNPIISLEQLCRSLTVNDLKDELIRKKIYELKLLIDERHKKQILSVNTHTKNPPMPVHTPAIRHAQRRRTSINDPGILLQSKTIDFQVPYDYTYHDIISNHNNTNYSQSSSHQHPIPSNPNREYQYT